MLLRRRKGGWKRATRLRLAGIPIGSGTWTIDVADTQYTAAANGSTSGLLRAFTGGQGDTTAHGTLNGGRSLSSIYAATISCGKKTDVIRITINNGNVKDLKVDPPQDDDPERVPLTEAHQHGVFDPMTASIVRMPGNGELLSSEACQRTLAVFDGRLRYDMQFAFKRMDKVKATKGYAGPVVVCSAYFSPVAGYIPVARGDQVPGQAARDGSMARPDRGNAGAGAVPRPRSDADRPSHPRGLSNSSRSPFRPALRSTARRCSDIALDSSPAGESARALTFEGSKTQLESGRHYSIL